MNEFMIPMLQKTTLDRGYVQENANHYKWQLRDYYQHPQNHHRDSGLDEPARRLLAPLNGELAAFKAELVRGVLVQHQ